MEEMNNVTEVMENAIDGVDANVIDAVKPVVTFKGVCKGLGKGAIIAASMYGAYTLFKKVCNKLKAKKAAAETASVPAIEEGATENEEYNEVN